MFFFGCRLELNTPDVKIYDGVTQEVKDGSAPLINLSSLRHLQHVTIRGAVYYEGQLGTQDHYFLSYLPTIVKIFQTAPFLRHLTIDIKVER